MKKWISACLALGLLLSLGGCKNTPEETIPTAAPSDTSAPSAPSAPSAAAAEPTEETRHTASQIPMASVFMPIMQETKTASDGTVIFKKDYPNISLIHQDPEVADRVILDFLNRVDAYSKTANTILARAEAEYTPDNWYAYSSHISYSPMRIDQGILSLFGEYAEYTGGNHAIRSNMSASYDLTTGDVLTLAGILSIGADPSALTKPICEALKAQEEEKYLFDDYPSIVQKNIEQDPSKNEAFYFTQKGLCFYFSPYEIAPYASGTIIAEIPYDKLTGILADNYFPAESAPQNGSIVVEEFNQADLSRYSQITEAVLDKSGSMILCHSDSMAENVRITLTYGDHQENSATIFAAQALSPGDALMIQANPEQLEFMTLSYDTKDGPKSVSPVKP